MRIQTLVATACMATFFSISANAAEPTIKESPHNVVETTDKLVAAVEQAGATVVARVDHAAGAASVGQELPPTTLLIFGNPRLGTGVMQADRLAGLDLPVKVLIYDEDGQTKVAFAGGDMLMERWNLGEASEPLDQIDTALTG